MTTLFAPSAKPRVFALPPGADFCAALVAGLDARLGDAPPEAMSDVEIWLNTRRAERRLRAAFAEGPPRLLPRLRVLSDLATDPLAPHSLPPEPPPLRSRLALSRLVGALVDAGSMLASSTAVFDLARMLEALLEELQGEGIDPAAIADIDPGPHAEHWQESLRFLRIVIDHGGAEAPRGAGRLRAAAEAWARHWEQAPRQTPVIVAGSTGSRGPTRAFMAAVAALPQGAVILPGVDTGLPGTAWQRLDPDSDGAADHPQSAIARVSRDLGVEPAELPLWHDAGPSAPERNRLVSLALRPAPVTDQWRAEGAALAGTLGPAMAGLTWLTAPDPRGEARACLLYTSDAADDEYNV